MYKDPTRWSFAFQSYVQLTMMQMHDHIKKSVMNRSKVGVKTEGSIPSPSSSTTITTTGSSSNSGPPSPPFSPPLLGDCQQNSSKKRKRTTLNSIQIDNDPIDCQDFSLPPPAKRSNFSHALTDKVKAELQIQLQDENEEKRCLNVMERSIFSARYIFVENLFQS